MKTLGQMLMDAYTKANTIETVSLIGDHLHIEHKANANEQLEAAFAAEFQQYAVERLYEPGFATEVAKIAAVTRMTSASEEQFLQSVAVHMAAHVLGTTFIKQEQP